jgi:Holliday junction resolvase RusA-like endonuclease
VTFKRDKKHEGLIHHREKPDADNILKSVMDALVLDDSSIFRVVCEKYWGDHDEVSVRFSEVWYDPSDIQLRE